MVRDELLLVTGFCRRRDQVPNGLSILYITVSFKLSLPFLLICVNLTNFKGSLLFTGGTSTRNYGDSTKRSSNGMVPLDPVREAAIARAQKKGRGDVQSTLDRRIVENDTPSGNGEWACNVCTLHNPVGLSCPQQTAFACFSNSLCSQVLTTCSAFRSSLIIHFPFTRNVVVFDSDSQQYYHFK